MSDKLLIAHTPEDAVAAKTGANAYIAGGTDVLRLDSDTAREEYVSIRRTEALRTLNVNSNSDTIEIGSALTFQELLGNPDIPSYLKEALSFMASRTRRNMATIGGNIAVCRDDSFLVPTLLAASARLMLLNNSLNRNIVSLEEYVSSGDKYADSLILSVTIPARGIAVRSIRSSNTAQSHARLTVSLGLNDGVYSGYAAIKNYGLVKLGSLMTKLSENSEISEEEIIEYVKNDSKIDLKDDLLYGGSSYRKYLLGVFIAEMFADIKSEGGQA